MAGKFREVLSSQFFDLANFFVKCSPLNGTSLIFLSFFCKIFPLYGTINLHIFSEGKLDHLFTFTCTYFGGAPSSH